MKNREESLEKNGKEEEEQEQEQKREHQQDRERKTREKTTRHHSSTPTRCACLREGRPQARHARLGQLSHHRKRRLSDIGRIVATALFEESMDDEEEGEEGRVQIETKTPYTQYLLTFLIPFAESESVRHLSFLSRCTSAGCKTV